MRCGYMYETKFYDYSRSIKFYLKADKLRMEKRMDHKCIFTDDELRDIYNDMPYIRHRFQHIITKNKRGCLREHKPLDVCRRCIMAHAKLDIDFDRTIYSHDSHRYLTQKRNSLPSKKYSTNDPQKMTYQHNFIAAESSIEINDSAVQHVSQMK
ncbi:hypothetical protein RF11_13270 [Thelohanellus kitauei]|uniref:Uncharacterized protein n=1 Tax=Thelohanellus kitauei TaxID=669202 RepID=A0A0C2JT34_THEKT|nr:hypothetical protein RF11_13270 [Thelohanellus kitauei]